MKKFMIDELNKAWKRLEAIFIFAARCLFIAFLNLMIVVIPTVMILFYILGSLAGHFATEERAVSPQAYATRSYTTSPSNITQALSTFTRNVNTWVSQAKLFRK